MEDKPKKKMGRPRIHPLPDPNAPKRPRGRQSKTPGIKRTTINFSIESDQEKWLSEIKASTGKSYGDIIDDIVRRYGDVE